MSYRVDGPVATLSLDHPENRNALTADLLDELGDGMAAAVADEGVRVVVLTHSGPVFCAGADLRAGPDAREPRHTLPAVLGALLDSPKPVVARLAGHALGGGVGLVAAADLSVMADDARLGFTEVRVGVAPAIISVVCLPRLSRGDALELFLTGERITAERAAQVGLITRAVPADELDTTVDKLVTMLLAGAPGALAASKALVARQAPAERDRAFADAAALSARLFAADEGVAGRAAFAARQSPPWAP